MFKSDHKRTVLAFFLGICVVLSLGAVTWVPGGGNYGTQNGATNSVSSPTIVSTTSNTVALAANVTAGGYENVRLRLIQNIGTVPVLYCLGGTASASNYHGVLAPGIAARDGLGSVLDLTSWKGSVSVAVESGTGSVSTVEVIR